MAFMKNGIQALSRNARPLFRDSNNIFVAGTRSCATSREYKPLPGSELSTVPTYLKKDGYKVVVVGGGCGGMAAAHMFNRKLGAGNVVVIEPKSVSFHLYEIQFVIEKDLCIYISCDMFVKLIFNAKLYDNFFFGIKSELLYFSVSFLSTNVHPGRSWTQTILKDPQVTVWLDPGRRRFS